MRVDFEKISDRIVLEKGIWESTSCKGICMMVVMGTLGKDFSFDKSTSTYTYIVGLSS